MQNITIKKSNFQFLTELGENNHRVWFNNNKDRYLGEQANLAAFADAVLQDMKECDEIVQESGKKCLYRIYRDIRFSKDKTPYKTNWGIGMKRDTKWRRGGYFYNVEPGNSFVAGGFWAPNREDLLRIRKEIEMDDKPLRKLIAAPQFQNYFGDLLGDKLKTAPRGFAKDHPAVDLLRLKQFLVKRDFTDKQVLAKGFKDEVVNTFKAMRPYLDYMSDVLTTDLNGVPIH